MGHKADTRTELRPNNSKEGEFGVKEISVMFATIGGFEVPSTASMDEIEEVSLRKEQLNSKLNEIVRKYGGLTDKIIRSFFMATFGTQTPHEDDAAHAVLSAMEMIKAVEDFQGALLFSTKSIQVADLDDQNIREGLRDEFEAHEHSLSSDISVSVQRKGTRWLITDNGADRTYAVEKVAEKLNISRGAKIHIGVNSGSAWVGELSAGVYKQTTVIGDTVNLSARLKGKAGLNQILVSPATFDLTKSLFLYEVLSPVSLKGITEPVPIFSVKGTQPEVGMITALQEGKVDDDVEEVEATEVIESIPPYLREKINAARRAVAGERKTVTMLYSDLSGFTALSEKFKEDPGKIAYLMDMCHEELAKVIYKYEGVIDQIVGDELMAIFGAPITHEDDPERAVQAGLEMLDAIKRFSKKMAIEIGMPPLDVHIGVNTGRVAIGNIGTDDAAKMDYTAIGEPVELAEMLEDISESGEMLAGERTYRLTRALFDYKEKARIDVGGNTVSVYQVLGKREQPQLKRGVDALNAVFIARDREFDALKLAADRLFEDRGHFVCTIGQAGLGKSRLKREFRKHLDEQVTWLEGSCFEHTQRTAYSVFIDAIRKYLEIHENDSDDVAKEKLIFKIKSLFRSSKEDLSEEIIPYIGNQLLSLRFEGDRADKVRYLDAEGRRQRTFAAVKDVLTAESKRRPLVLALDDLHWVDPVSLDLIFFLMETAIDQPILQLCLYRPERTDPCWKIGAQAAERLPQDFTEITLSPMSPEASRDLLEGLLSMGDVENAAKLKERILQKASGNPFYMEEVLRSLIDDQVIVRNGTRWAVQKDIDDINVPDTLQQMMEARIDKMPSDQKEVLQRGSVIGRVFEYDILENIAVGLGSLGEYISRLTALDMVELQMPPTDPPEYIFQHLITHGIVYSSIPGQWRRDLHTQVGSCMETKHQAHLERVYELLAQHYHNGNNLEKAVAYLTKAGTKAKGQYNNESALTFYQHGLEYLTQIDEGFPEERREIREGLGDVHTILGDFDAAIENYTETLRDATAPVYRASLKRKMANVYGQRSENNVAMEILNSALEDLQVQPDAAEEAQIYNLVGWVYSRKSDFTRAIEASTKALQLIESTPRADITAAIYKNLGMYYHRKGEGDRSNAYFRAGMEQADQIGDKLLMSQLYNNIGANLSKMAAQTDAALENLEQSIQIKEQLGYLHGLGQSYINVAMIHSERGNFDLALKYYARVLDIGERTGAPKGVADAHTRMGNVFWRKKEFDRAIEHHQAALESHTKIDDLEGQAESYANLILAYVSKNDLDAAREFVPKGLELAEKLDTPEIKAAMYTNIGLIEKHQETWDGAMRYFRKAAEIAEESGAKRELAAAYRYIGEVLLGTEDTKQAGTFFRKAIALYKQLKHSREVEELEAQLRKCETSRTGN